jgi:hypothetical protein
VARYPKGYIVENLLLYIVLITVDDFRVVKGAAQQKYENLSHITTKWRPLTSYKSKLTYCIGPNGFG